MEIKAVKSAFGWKAENYFPIDSTTRITITTMKRYSGQLTTTVVASQKEGGMWYYTVCKDYSMTYIRNIKFWIADCLSINCLGLRSYSLL